MSGKNRGGSHTIFFFLFFSAEKKSGNRTVFLNCPRDSFFRRPFFLSALSSPNPAKVTTRRQLHFCDSAAIFSEIFCLCFADLLPFFLSAFSSPNLAKVTTRGQLHFCDSAAIFSAIFDLCFENLQRLQSHSSLQIYFLLPI